MNGCKHEWHDYHRLSFPCPDCGAWADEGNSSATDYHELPEAPRCCLTCAYFDAEHLECENYETSNRQMVRLGIFNLERRENIRVAPHGLCSHWERRDETS